MTLLDSFVSKQLELLTEEREAEISDNLCVSKSISIETLKRKGICIPKLRISSLKTGLYGRTVTLFSSKSGKELPFHVLSSGDIVQIRHIKNEDLSNANGVVLFVSSTQISVAFDSSAARDELENLLSNDNTIYLVKVANEVTYRRLRHALNELGKYSSNRGRSQRLIDVLFGSSTPSPIHLDRLNGFTLINSNLNQSQIEAVKTSVLQEEVAIIHGPPGTGKTTTVVEIIAQLAKSGMKVLACAPSNVAVDNLVEKLGEVVFTPRKDERPTKLKLVRLGHPARIEKQHLQNISLDALVSRSDAACIVRDVRADIESLLVKLRKTSHKDVRYNLRKERKELYSELAKREKSALHEILSTADVILSTNVGAHPKGPLRHLENDHFDVVVIDECGQALEASCWIPLLNNKKCILAGDHLQLPPTIISKRAAHEGLSVTLLERLVSLHGDKIVCMLTEQYRMNNVIMQWASQQMYEGKLKSNLQVKDHLLCDLPNVSKNEETSLPMLLIDTSGCDMGEVETEESDSKANLGEARIVFKHVTCLQSAGVALRDIAVVSPYNLQVELLRKLLKHKYPSVEVKSVDGFQGREKEAVILSMVRSNRDQEVGFLADKRRLNVAVTRARRHLAVVCDCDTVSKHDFIRTLVDYMTTNGEVRSGFEYENTDEDFNIDDEELFEEIFKSYYETKKQSKKASGQHSYNSQPKKVNALSRQHVVKKNDFDFKEKYRHLLRQYFELKLEIKESPEQSAANLLSKHLNAADVVWREGALEFPSSLSPGERKSIHELCEEVGLSHTSEGKGTERRIVVRWANETDIGESRRVISDDSDVDITENEPTLLNANVHQHSDQVFSGKSHSMSAKVLNDVEEKIQVNAENETNKLQTSAPDKSVLNSKAEFGIVISVCDKCGKSLPEANMSLHQLHCERLVKIKTLIESQKNEKPKDVKIKTKGVHLKSNKKSTKKKLNTRDDQNDDDFDSIINEAMASNRLCCHGNCSSFVGTTGQLCNICRRTFCLKHFLPEIHGCGVNAKANARKQISRDGVLFQGGGVPDRKLPGDKRAALKTKLANKVKSCEEMRKGNNKSTKK